jgi:hypothetical protein
MEWKFERQEREFETIPVGKHRIRIASVDKAISKSGNDMLTIKFDVSGYSSKIWHYIVFLIDHPEITNRNLTQLFDSFGIPDGDFDTNKWVGKVGGCMTKEDEYGVKIRYFLTKKQQEELPPWKDTGDGKVKFEELSDDDYPF